MIGPLGMTMARRTNEGEEEAGGRGNGKGKKSLVRNQNTS